MKLGVKIESGPSPGADETATPDGAARPSPSGRAVAVAALACAGFGLLMAVLPHLIWWPRLGAPIYAADYDEFGLYLPIAAQAYDNHPTYLGDPTRTTPAPSMYPWAQFVPAILAAKALGLGPMGVSLVWRVWTGLSIGLAWFLVVRHFVKRPWASAAIACALAADVGVFSGHVLLRPLRTVYQSLALPPGPTDALYPTHIQWRLITPGLSFAFLWLHVWLLARARDVPSRGRLLASGIGFGLLFHVYFYFWTSACLGLAAAWLLDAGHRRVYFHTGWIGGLIGLPAIVAGAMLKKGSPEWLHRTDNFLPIARLSELEFPRLAMVVIPVTFAWVLLRRRDLIHLWALTLAGLLLLNHQVVTGLQIQNFHWTYVWGPGVSLLLVLLTWGELSRRRPWPRGLAWALAALAAFEVGAGLWLRVFEAGRTASTVSALATFQEYRSQRLAPGVAPLEPNAVVAGDDGFVAASSIFENQRCLAHYPAMYSPAIDAAEWSERVALEAFLDGTGRSEFERSEGRKLAEGWGPWNGDRNPALRAEELARRLRLYDAIAADPADAIRRYRVRYVGVHTGTPLLPALRRLAKPVQSGPTWDVWEIEPGAGR